MTSFQSYHIIHHMSRTLPDITAAKAFAHKWHDFIGQVRKYSNQPYWVHTDEVAETVASVELLDKHPIDNDDAIECANMICAAHGHDLLEDVLTYLVANHTTDIVQQFLDEYDVTFTSRSQNLIIQLTDVYTRETYPDKNRAERKRLERERIGKDDASAKTIKLADLISNTRSIVAEDEGFAKIYLKEKFAMLGELSNGNPILLQRATEITLQGFQKLGLTIPFISGTVSA